jgi:hypothetical protein
VKIYKIAKHMSDHSHNCLLCGDNLRPTGFNRNSKHHFPWGITYKCGCNKSNIWTNSIRGYKEFKEIVFNNKKIRMIDGFCNDLYCGICYSNVRPIINGLGLENGKPTIWCRNKDKTYIIKDWNRFMQVYYIGKDFSRKYDSSYMGEEATNISAYYDIFGCEKGKHNTGIIWNGHNSEYGEAEYGSIYNWCKKNKGIIPAEMISDMEWKS